MAQRGRSARETQEEIQAAHSELARKRSRPSISAWYILVGITLIFISVSISVAITYVMTNPIDQNVDELDLSVQEIGVNVQTLTTSLGEDVMPQIGEIEKRVNEIEKRVNTTDGANSYPSGFLNVGFTCIDSASKVSLSDCMLHFRIQDETIIREFNAESGNQAPIVIPVSRRLEITANKNGYKTATETFEYVEDGTFQSHDIELEKTAP